MANRPAMELRKVESDWSARIRAQEAWWTRSTYLEQIVHSYISDRCADQSISSLVRARSDEQSTVAASVQDDLSLGSVPLLDQVLGRVEEVVKYVLLQKTRVR